MLKVLNNYKYWLFFICTIAFLLRVTGVNHGFPFIFHPDEPTVVRSALSVRFYPNPKHFDWPHFYIYFNYFYYMGFTFLRKFLNPLDFSFFYNDEWVFYFLTRLSSAFFGTFTIFGVFYTARSLFNNKVAILSCLAFALLPIHIQYSHYSLPEAPMIFFLTFFIYFCTKILNDHNLISKKITFKNSINFILAGFFIGLSSSTKYNAGLLAFLVPLSVFLSISWHHQYVSPFYILKKFFTLKNITFLSISGIFAIFGFLIGTPFSLLDFKTFLRTDSPKGALWQFTNVGSTKLNQQFSNFIYNIFIEFPKNTGYTIYGVFVILFLIVIIGLIIYQKRYSRFFVNKSDLIKLSFLYIPAFIITWYMSGFEKNRSHYYMILYPFVVIAFGYFVNVVLSYKNVFLKYLITIILFIFPLYFSILTTVSFTLIDNRSAFYNWLNMQNSQVKESVFVYDYNILQLVFKKAQVSNYKKNYDKVKNYDFGYYIGTKFDQYFILNYQYKPIKSFNNSMALGDSIYVYEFLKVE